MPSEFKTLEQEERLNKTNTWKGAGWKTVELQPHLMRQVEKTDIEDLTAKKQGTVVTQQTSYFDQKKQMAEEQAKAIED